MRFSESAWALEALENTVSRLQLYELLDGLFDSADGGTLTVAMLGTWDGPHIRGLILAGYSKTNETHPHGIVTAHARVMRPLETDTIRLLEMLIRGWQSRGVDYIQTPQLIPYLVINQSLH